MLKEQQPGSSTSSMKKEEVVQPNLPNDIIAEQHRKRINRFFGTAAAILLLGGIAGFLPTYYTHYKEGRWYFDAVSRQNFLDTTKAEQRYKSIWKTLLAIHAVTTVAWTLLAGFQVASGATGKPGGQRKAVHRRVGYCAAFMAVLIVVEAVALQLLKGFGFGSIPILGNAFMICLNLFLGIWYIRNKRVPQHKLAMLWACAWTAAPGLTRMINYAQVVFGGGCHVGFYACGALSIIMLCLLPSALKVKDARSWLFYVNVFTILILCTGDVLATMRGHAINGTCSPHI